MIINLIKDYLITLTSAIYTTCVCNKQNILKKNRIDKIIIFCGTYINFLILIDEIVSKFYYHNDVRPIFSEKTAASISVVCCMISVFFHERLNDKNSLLKETEDFINLSFGSLLAIGFYSIDFHQVSKRLKDAIIKEADIISSILPTSD